MFLFLWWYPGVLQIKLDLWTSKYQPLSKVFDQDTATETATADTTPETTTSEFESMSSTDSFKPIPTRILTTLRKKIVKNTKSEIYRPTIKTFAQTKPILTTPENLVRNSILSPSVKPSPGFKVKYLKIFHFSVRLTLADGLCEDHTPKNRFCWKLYCRIDCIFFVIILNFI